MLDLPRIRALCWDVDGTLRDTDNQYVALLSRLLQPAGFMFPSRDTTPFARRAVMALESPGTFLYSIPDRLGIDNPLAQLVSAIDQRLPARSSDRFTMIPGAFEALAALGPRYPMAIVTARSEPATLAFLDKFGLRPLFRCIATALTCWHAKPYPDQVLWAAQQMHVAPSECLMIGDTTVDIRAGRAAGAQTAGVLCGFGELKELSRAGADAILTSTAELPAMLTQARDDTLSAK